MWCQFWRQDLDGNRESQLSLNDFQKIQLLKEKPGENLYPTK